LGTSNINNIAPWVHGAHTVLVPTWVFILFFIVIGLMTFTWIFAMCVRGFLRKLIKNGLTRRRLSSLSWREFEQLTAYYFTERRYNTHLSGGGQADGGVDLIVSKRGRTGVVQCKHWKKPVGVSVVREMLGVKINRSADYVFVVSSSGFSRVAVQFAREESIILVGPDQLMKLLPNLKR
ncbi:restriction endonuclease, partial [Vibrio splendidus]